MELQRIVDRYAEAISHADAVVGNVRVNSRTGAPYLPGFKSLDEADAVSIIDATWERLHPGELRFHDTKVSYPDVPRAACDHVLTANDGSDAPEEWGIEVKRLQFVGDNGKGNDFALAKTLSPYLKDRGLLHDAARLRHYGFTRRVAVIGYSFDYDLPTMAEAERRHSSPQAATVIAEVRKVLERNGGSIRTRPLIEFADAILVLRGFTTGPRAQAEFEAWCHPAGGRGVVFGWEIRRPELEPDYDPRHPW